MTTVNTEGIQELIQHMFSHYYMSSINNPSIHHLLWLNMLTIISSEIDIFLSDHISEHIYDLEVQVRRPEREKGASGTFGFPFFLHLSLAGLCGPASPLLLECVCPER